MKQSIFAAFLLLTFSSCTQRGCQSLERQIQFSERQYNVKMYSGGEVVFEDSFTGIINQEENSDGMYYTKDGHLIELSGDYVITSIDK